MKKKEILLGVNIDHVATLRQARFTRYPDPILAAQLAETAGADGITVHLREDRRHIAERDVSLLQETLLTRLNLEMAVTDSMLAFAKSCKPIYCCFVPEKREELTTEGGLDLISETDKIKDAVLQLHECGIQVSLFIDPDRKQIEAALKTQAPFIELHTGAYADAKSMALQHQELARIQDAAQFATQAGLKVNAGHGLNYQNVQAIACIPEIHELNIGHAIIARAVMTGIKEAVSTMKQIMLKSRSYG